MTVSLYPGHVLARGQRGVHVELLQTRLKQLGFYAGVVDGQFGERTDEAVMRFQTSSTDASGNVLQPDGQIGPITWMGLFGQDAVPKTTTPSSLLAAEALRVAADQIGVMEVPPGSNRGPQVEAYLASVGVAPGNAWCAAFVYWCFAQAASRLNVPNPCIKTGGVQMHWLMAAEQQVPRVDIALANQDLSLIKPGMVFLLRTGNVTGHTGFVETVNGGFLTTIEGNTNDGGGREGVGVFRRQRKLSTVTLGFLAY